MLRMNTVFPSTIRISIFYLVYDGNTHTTKNVSTDIKINIPNINLDKVIKFIEISIDNHRIFNDNKEISKIEFG